MAEEGVKKGVGMVKYPVGDDLRKVEMNVLIPKIMKERAKERCSHYVKEFEDCARGRTISVVWACREANKKMEDCYISYYQNEEFKEECKKEYLQRREEYRKTREKSQAKDEQ